jgi:tRNA dimethylallyltransferase
VIVGPTAAGKSAVAMWLAERLGNVTIVSADSRQVYRGFDVGTAKPTPAERARVPHAGIDLVEPVVRYSAFAWADAAAEAIVAARAGGRTPVVVGGTGLYVRTLFEPGFVEPPLDPARRAALQAVLARMSTETVRRWCEHLDPSRATLGRVQLLRSVEIALLTGHRLSELHANHRRAPRWSARYLVVDPGAVLGRRIEERARAMLAGAWQAEVAALLARVPADAPAWKASGYVAVREHVAGGRALDATIERVVIETRQYAKRQRTWFRHQLPAEGVLRLDPTQPGWEDVVLAWWTEGTEERT